MDVCCYQMPMDAEHKQNEMGALYYGIKSLLKFEVLDQFGNLIEEIADAKYYDVTIEYSDISVRCFKWKMRSGTIFASFLPKMIGKKQMVVRFVDRRLHSMNDSTFPHRMSIIILYPPCSPSITLKFLGDNFEPSCTAGKEFIFDLQFYDVFENPAVRHSNETCGVVVEAHSLETAMNQHGEEQVKRRRIDTSEYLSFAVSACFKIAGLRKLRLTAYSGSKSSSKTIYINVLPSAPDRLNSVRFTTNGAVDKSFSADPKMMYTNQWSIIEATLVDFYDNVVGELNNDYNISLKLSNDNGKETVIEYKDSGVKNGRIGVQVKINETWKHNLSITLTDRNCPDQIFHLKEIQIEVIDAPLNLAESKFHYPNTGVAGKAIQLDILPFDVFGCPVPASSTKDCIISGDILDFPLEQNEYNEAMDFKISQNESNTVICASIVLKRAGRRKLMIFRKENKAMKQSSHLHCKKDLFYMYDRLHENIQ